MAPTKKAAAKKSTTTKAKAVKIVRKPKHEPPSKKKKAPPPTLPKDWPVTSRPPIFPPTASALAPGNLLQHTCSGNDIHLARNAVARPSLAKEKGKYLLILPGNLSLKKLASDKKKGSLSQASNNGLSQNTVGLSQSSGDATKKAAVPTLGTVQDLNTDYPKFVIPFPDGRTLVFPGKIVETTSKYIMLSCSMKKKGSVACKSIFSSAVVFGQPKWQKTKVEKTDISVIEDEDMEENSFSHYGGSHRTEDGVGRGKNAKRKNDGPLLIPIHSKQPQSMSLQLKDYATKPSASSPPELSSGDDEDSDDEYHSDMKIGATTTFSATKRLAPKRNATRKQKYTQNSDDDDDEDEDSGNEAVKKPVTKRTARGTRGASAIQKRMQQSTYSDDEDTAGEDESVSRVRGKGTAATPTKKGMEGAGGKTEPIELNSDDDSDRYSGDDDVPAATRRSASRRQSTSRSKPKYAEEGSGIDEESEESEEEEPKTKPIKKDSSKSSNTASSKKRRAATIHSDKSSNAKPIVLDDDDDDASVNSYSDGSSKNEKAIPERRTLSRRSSAKKRPNFAKVFESSESDSEAEEDESNGKDLRKTNARRPASKPSTAPTTNSTKQRKNSPSVSHGSKAEGKQASSRRNSSNVSVLETISPSQEKQNSATRKCKLSDSAQETTIDLVDYKNENDGSVDNLEMPTAQRKHGSNTVAGKPPLVSRNSEVEVVQSPSTSIKSPARSRRRKSPGGKPSKSPATRTLDLTNDDEFNFGT